MTAPDNSDSVLEQQRLIQEIAALIPTEVEHDWVRLEFRVICLAPLMECHLDSLSPDGSVKSGRTPREIWDKLEELRALMYEEGRGTWISCRWVLIKDQETGSVNVTPHFNYDEEIRFVYSVAPVNFLAEQHDFPRDEQHAPLWFRYALQKGREALAAHNA